MMWVTVLSVQLGEGDKWVSGIGIGPEPGTHDFDCIIVNGQSYETVWNYYVESYKGSFVLRPE